VGFFIALSELPINTTRQRLSSMCPRRMPKTNGSGSLFQPGEYRNAVIRQCSLLAICLLETIGERAAGIDPAEGLIPWYGNRAPPDKTPGGVFLCPDASQIAPGCDMRAQSNIPAPFYHVQRQYTPDGRLESQPQPNPTDLQHPSAVRYQMPHERTWLWGVRTISQNKIKNPRLNRRGFSYSVSFTPIIPAI
jgi:hypothetical protein